MNTQSSQSHMEKWFLEMTAPNSPYCNKGIGAKFQPTFVSCDLQTKTVTLAYSVMDWQLNPHKSMHGGLTATAIQFTMELLGLYFTNGKKVALISAETAYQKPITIGKTIHVTVKITAQTNQIFFHGGAYFADTNSLASSASGIFSLETDAISQ
ncbi:hotdog fold domain-containing protein [Chakrabartyella piscis]|uniref:hotdog fold domain-containing protein n=1 Tax=Chakrabartyella piscis TaxID=2918914 RepID=UPI002958369D|nr:hotdog fold domain-containing protein [Chakrabartyella piscis]